MLLLRLKCDVCRIVDKSVSSVIPKLKQHSLRSVLERVMSPNMLKKCKIRGLFWNMKQVLGLPKGGGNHIVNNSSQLNSCPKSPLNQLTNQSKCNALIIQITYDWNILSNKFKLYLRVYKNKVHLLLPLLVELIFNVHSVRQNKQNSYQLLNVNDLYFFTHIWTVDKL